MTVRIHFFRKQKKRDHPREESEKHHRYVKPRHDEEIENAVLEDCSHQSAHA